MARPSTDINPLSSLRLRELMKEEGVRTQKEFAEKVDFSENHVSKLLKGSAPLTSTMARAIEEKFPNTRAAYLMGLDDFKTTADAVLSLVAKDLTNERYRTKAVKYLLASLGVWIEPNEEYAVFPEVGKLSPEKLTPDMIRRLYDASSRNDAYIIKKDGSVAGHCSEANRKKLYDEILDYTEYLISKLCREEEHTDGKPD